MSPPESLILKYVGTSEFKCDFKQRLTKSKKWESGFPKWIPYLEISDSPFLIPKSKFANSQFLIVMFLEIFEIIWSLILMSWKKAVNSWFPIPNFYSKFPIFASWFLIP